MDRSRQSHSNEENKTVYLENKPENKTVDFERELENESIDNKNIFDNNESNLEKHEDKIKLEIRPKIRTEIKFIRNDDKHWKVGKVTKVGKSNGKDKFRCWIKTSEGEKSYDFVKDITNWMYFKVKRVIFNTATDQDNETIKPKELENTGVWFLENYSTRNKNATLGDVKIANKVLKKLLLLLYFTLNLRCYCT